jgi:parallel beta-helix repeat protein
MVRFLSATRIAAACFVLTGSASAATLYVATTGSDTSTGTSISAPLATITKAAALAKAGDVVQVRGGVYNQLVKIGSTGAAGSMIVFQPYAGESAVIDGTGTTASDLVTITGQFVEFNGFEVRNSSKIGICAWGARNIRIVNNNVHHAVKGGIYSGYSTFGTAADVTISGNTVTNTVLENQYHTTSGGWSQTIGIQNTDRGRVTNNKVYNNDGEGIVFVLSDNGIATGNEVFDNYSVEMYLDNAQFTKLDGNLIYSTANSRYYRNGLPAHGIGMANEAYSTSNPLTDNTITNNIVLNSNFGIYYGNYDLGGGIKNTTIANNTIYGASKLLSIESSTHANSVVQNNIFFAPAGGTMASVAGGGVTYRNNNWYGGPAGSAAGAGDVIANPMLANAGGTRAIDYKLTTGSPNLQKGISVTGVSSDYFGAARPALFDIGAHQLSSAVPSDTLAPTVPASLNVTHTTSSMTLTWTASVDNIGVTGYRVYRNGALIATSSVTSYLDGAVTATGVYSYQVSAIDAAGNESAVSAIAWPSAGAPVSSAPVLMRGRVAGH